MRDECAVFARRLREVLAQRNQTQTGLGRQMAATARLRGLREIAPVPRQTISEWVRGRRMPAADYALLLCYTFEVTPSSLGLEGLLTPATIASVKEAAARAGVTDHVRARQADVRVGPVADLESAHLAAVLHSTRKITPHDASAQWSLTLDLLGLRTRQSALTLLPLLSSHMVGLRDMMRLADSGRVWRELGMQVAEVACASAQLWHTQLDLGRAMSGYSFALRLAKELDEDSVRALACTGMALLYADELHEGEGLPAPPSTSRDLMAEAERAASGCAPAYQLWTHAARSWQRAGRRDDRGAGADLEAAHRALARMERPPVGFLTPIDATYVTVCEGKCAALLGRPDQAVRLYERAADGAGPQIRVFYDVERARAALAAGQVELAVGLLMAAVDEGDRTGSTMITRRVQTIATRRLTPYRGQPDVRALEERLRSVA